MSATGQCATWCVYAASFVLLLNTFVKKKKKEDVSKFTYVFSCI